LGLTRRLDGWAVFTLLAALLVAGPLIGLPLSFVAAPGSLSRFSGLLPEALAATAVLLAGVGAGVLLLGTALAALVSFCDFPGRRWIEWALVLPLAMPGYVFTLFALGLELPAIRSTCSPAPPSWPSRARCSRRRADWGCRAAGPSLG
jgi:iron(III) transport system permease protein